MASNMSTPSPARGQVGTSSIVAAGGDLDADSTAWNSAFGFERHGTQPSCSFHPVEGGNLRTRNGSTVGTRTSSPSPAHRGVAAQSLVDPSRTQSPAQTQHPQPHALPQTSSQSPINPSIPPPPSNEAIEEIIARAQALAGSVGPSGFDPRYHVLPPHGSVGGGIFPRQHQHHHAHQGQQYHTSQQHLYPVGPGAGHPGHHVAFNQGGQAQGIGMMGIVPGANVGGDGIVGRSLSGDVGAGQIPGIGSNSHNGGSGWHGIDLVSQQSHAQPLTHNGSYGNGFGPIPAGLHPAAVGADGRVNLFIGNLPFRVRWQDVKDLFRRAGTVLRADVSLDSQTNRSRGYGSVLMGSREDGAKAIELFNGYTWQSRVLEVRPDRLPPEYEPQPYNPPSTTGYHPSPHPLARSPYSEHPPSIPQYHMSHSDHPGHHMHALDPTHHHMGPIGHATHGSSTPSHSAQAGGLMDAISPMPANKDPRGLDRTMSRSPFTSGRGTPPPRPGGLHALGDLNAGPHSRRPSGMAMAFASDLDGTISESQGSQGSGPRRSSEMSDGARASDAANRTLHVSNLPFQMQWQDLKDLFRSCGTIIRADIVTGSDNRSKGFGTVLLATEADAMNAMKMLNGHEHGGRVLHVRPDRLGPMPTSGYNSAVGAPPPSSLAPVTHSQAGHASPMYGPQSQVDVAPAAVQTISQYRSGSPYGTGATATQSELDPLRPERNGGPTESPTPLTATPSKESAIADHQHDLRMGAIGIDRPHALRAGVAHPGRIVMPIYPNFGQNGMSPIQSTGRGMPPMTPSMPGFTFHAYPVTPPLHPMSFMSPGVGPFSPAMMTPGSPLNFPTGGFQPFHSAAPGAPIGRQTYPVGQTYGVGQGRNAEESYRDQVRQQGGGQPGYFPHVDSRNTSIEHNTPVAKPARVNGHEEGDPSGAISGLAGAVEGLSVTDNIGGVSGTNFRDSRASLDLARPDGLSSSMLLDRDRRASLDDKKRSSDVDN